MMEVKLKPGGPGKLSERNARRIVIKANQKSCGLMKLKESFLTKMKKKNVLRKKVAELH